MRILLAAGAWLATASCLLGQIPAYTLTSVDTTCNPAAIAVDGAGNVFEACVNSSISGGSLIRKVSLTGAITTVAGGGPTSQFNGDGGPATNATLNVPSGLAIDSAGEIYIADGNRIRKVSASGIITTIAGPGPTNGALGDGGPATNATVNPRAIALDTAGDLYITENAFGNCRVRELSPAGIITTAIGNGTCAYSGDGGPATNAELQAPGAIAIDSAGNIYIVDTYVVRRVSPAGIITAVAGQGYPTYYGDGGPATLAGLDPDGVAVDGAGNIYVSGNSGISAEQFSSAYSGPRIQLVTTDGNINSIAGPFTPVPLTPVELTIYSGAMAWGGGSKIYVAANNGLALLTPTGKTFSTPGPSIATFRNASAFQPSYGGGVLGQGSWVEILGNYLAPDSRSWTSADFSGTNAPTSLDGTSVTIGGQPAFISYISPAQVNAQVPTNIGTGSLPLVVTTGAGSGPAWVTTINPTAPELLAPPSFKIGGKQYVVALFPDGVTYVLPTGAIPGVPSRPATAGDTITLYGVGFGYTTPSAPAGQITESASALTVPFSITPYPAGAAWTVTYAGLAPGVVGLYQFNVVVPKLSTAGAVPFTFGLGRTPTYLELYVATQ